MAIAELDQARLAVIRDVKKTYFQLYVLDKSIAVTQANKTLLVSLIDVANAQFTTGKRPQSDVLRVQVELATLETKLLDLHKRRRSGRAELNRLLNRPTVTPVPPIEDFTARETEYSHGNLFSQAMKSNPIIRRAQYEIARDRDALDLAKLAYHPDISIGFEWIVVEPRDAFELPVNMATGVRPSSPQLSEEGSDNWAINFGFNVPIWVQRIEAGINEAKMNLAATTQRLTATRNKVERQLFAALESLRTEQESAKLFEHAIIPQAEQAFRTSQTSYTSGRTDFINVIENWQRWLMLTIEYYKSIGALEQAVADLEQAAGMSLAEFDQLQD